MRDENIIEHTVRRERKRVRADRRHVGSLRRTGRSQEDNSIYLGLDGRRGQRGHNGYPQTIGRMVHMEIQGQMDHPPKADGFHQLLYIKKDIQEDCWGSKIKGWWRTGHLY